MQLARKVISGLIVAACICGVSADGSLRAAAAKPVHPRIDSAVASGNAAQRAWAIKRIAYLLQAPNHYSAPYRLEYGWLPTLLSHQHYKAVAKLALLDILQNPGSTDNVDAVLADRVQALLALGKAKAALRNAKSLFNICTLADTKAALLLVRKSVAAVYRNHPWIVQAFIGQQIAGAKIPADEHEPIIRCGVLAAVKVNAAAYERKLEQLRGSGNWTLLEKGNLLLLADQPEKAIKDFRTLAAMAANAKDFLSDENHICRAIKAEDGTIGRANAHLLSSVKAAQKFP